MFFPGPTTAAVSATGSSSSRTNKRTTTNNNVLVIIGGLLIIILPVAIAIGYVLGSSSASSSSLTLSSLTLTSFDDILNAIEKIIDTIIVPLYAFGVFSYLIMTRCYYYSSSSLSSSSSSSSSIIHIVNNKNKKKDVMSSSETKRIRQQGYSTNISTSTTSATTDTIHEEEEEEETGDDDCNDDDDDDKLLPINMTGSYKVIANQNFDEFLKAQGVPWFLCNAASKARPTHTFTHSSSSTTNNNLTIHIKGIIDSETTYDIGSGSYNITTIRGRTFHDTVTYLYDDNETENENENENDGEENDEIASNTTITSSDDSDTIIDKHDSSSSSNNNNNKKNCIGIQTHKVAVGEGYKVHVQRRFIKAGKTYNTTTTSNDGSTTTTDKDHNYDLHDICNNDRLLMLNKIIFDDPTKDPVIASQLFHKI